MKANYKIIFMAVIIVVALIFLSLYASNRVFLSPEDKEGSLSHEAEEARAVEDEQASSVAEKRTAEGYEGELLAGNESLYLVFNNEDYHKALLEDKIILLYFYANWCPECRKEQPQTISAFNELKNNDLIGFRVNYKDSDTDDDEVALAKEFGISYQHTKVIIKNGMKILKAPDSWDKERYLEELNKVS